MNNKLFQRVFVLPKPLQENATMRRMYLSALFGIGLSFAYLILIPLIFPEHAPDFLPFLVVSLLFFPIFLLLARLKEIKRLVLIYLLGCWTVITALVFSSGGTLAPFFGFYTVLIMFAVLIADWQLARVIGGMTLLAGLILAYLGMQRMIPPPIATPLSAWITQSLIMLLLIVLAFLIAGDMKQAIMRLQEELAERKQVEQRLRESEEKFRSVFELVPYGIVIQHLNGNLAAANKTFLDTIGYRLDQLIHQNIFDTERFSIFRDRATLEAIQRDLRQTGHALNHEIKITRADGQETTHVFSSQLVEISAEPHILTIAIDVTERKRSEAEVQALNTALAEKAAHFQILNEIAQDISSISELEFMLKRAMTKLRTVLPMDAFYVSIYDRERDTISFPILFDDEHYWEQPPIPLPRPTTTSQVIETGREVLLNRTPEEMALSRHLLGNTERVSASMIVCPLTLGQVVIGAISVHSYLLNAYTLVHLQLLRDVAYQVAVAVENARLYESLRRELDDKRRAESEIRQLNAELEQKATQLAILNDIAHEVSTLSDLKSTLQRTLDKLKAVVQLDTFYVALYTAEDNEVSFPLMYDNHQYWNQPPGSLSRFGLSAQVLESGKPVFKNRTEAEIQEVQNDTEMMLVRLGDQNRVSASMIIVPLLLGGKAIGMISIQSYTLNAYTQKHVDLLVGVAYQIAVALDNANLYDSLRKELSTRKQAEEQLSRLNAELEDRAAQLTTINEIAYEISGLTDLKGTLRRTLEKLKSNVQLDVFYVGLYNPENDLVSFPIMYDAEQFWDEAPSRLTRPGMTAQVLDTIQPLLINRTQAEIQALEVATKPEGTMVGNRNQVSASIVIAPLVLGRRAIGFISMQSYSLYAFSQKHVQLLMGVAYQVAVAVDNANLYDSLWKELTTRRQAEQQLAQLNVELEQRVIQRTAQLEATNRELEAFAYSVSHDLRAPLRGIDGFSQALLEDYEASLDQTGQNYLRRIRFAAQRMGAMIDSILTLSRITRAQLVLKTVNLSQIATEIMSTLQEDHPSRVVVADIAPDIYAECDVKLMQIALYNLLENAWKYSSKVEQSEIKFGCSTEGDETIYFVSDNGIGFDMQHVNKLFTAFQRLHTDQEFPGNGIGLATVQRVINRHGGRIWAKSRPHEGAQFFFTLGTGGADS